MHPVSFCLEHRLPAKDCRDESCRVTACCPLRKSLGFPGSCSEQLEANGRIGDTGFNSKLAAQRECGLLLTPTAAMLSVCER